MMNRFILIILLFCIAACRNNENPSPETGNNDHVRMSRHRWRHRGAQQPADPDGIIVRGDSVFVPKSCPVYSKMKLQTIYPEEYLTQFTTTGVVKPMSGHLAQVTSPFEGRIVKSFTRLGQKVTTGMPLFEVSSSDYLESVRMFMQARRERELAEKNYTRKKDLLETGIGSHKEYDEAKLQFDLADKELEKTSAILSIFNIGPDDADLGKPLIVRSPISGEIVQSDITVGQYIKSDSDPIVTVADLKKIWIVARVKEKDLGSISLKDPVEVFTESQPEKPTKGSVDYIGNIMNEQTRSVEVFIECENNGQSLKSGMFVTVWFYHKLSDAMIVPASAVLQDYNRSYLFLQTGPELYIKKEVAVRSIPENRLIVSSGLDRGSLIVSEGAIYLH
jgi:cobalt-zinc-cadmium efflux system membrane fusion protein